MFFFQKGVSRNLEVTLFFNASLKFNALEYCRCFFLQSHYQKYTTVS